MTVSRCCVWVTLTAILGSTSNADEPLSQLLRRVPATANAMAIIDVKAMNESPIGVREGWKDRRGAMTEELGLLPRDTGLIVLGAGLDLTNPGRSWSLALVDLERPTSTAELVRMERGVIDRVSGREVVWTPRNAFFAAIRPTLLARYSPGNRQEFGKWLKFESSAVVSKISPYLDRASNAVGRSVPMVLAVDLEDAFLPAVVSEAVNDSRAIEPGADKEKVAKVLASLQGLSIYVSVGQEITGTITIEFREPVAPLGKMAKPLFLEALSHLGAEIEGLETWDVITTGSLVTLKGKLTTAMITRMLSLFDLPSQSYASTRTDPEAPPSPQSQGEATRKYFRSIGVLLDDLKAQKATSQGGAALWYGRYARKVDQLPVLDVDSDMLNYGQWIAESLRAVSTSFDGVSAAAGYRNTLTTGYYGGGGNREAGSRIRKQENILADKVYHDTWETIENRSSALRKTMTQKYRVEF